MKKKIVTVLVIAIISISAISVYAFNEINRDKSPHLGITVNELAVSHTESFPFKFTVTPINFKSNYKYTMNDISMIWGENAHTESMKNSLTVTVLSDSTHSESNGIKRPSSYPVQFNTTFIPIPVDFNMTLSLYMTYTIIEYDVDGSMYTVVQSNKTITLYSP